MNRIHLQFCSSKDVRAFEEEHYVRKMTADADGITPKSKEVGKPRGHHGQQIHYLIWYKTDTGWEKVGAISGGSAVYTTKCRDDFFKITKENREKVINGIIDNTLFRLVRHEKNLASKVVSLWRRQVVIDWEYLYDVKPYGFETFVEYAEKTENGKHRAGALYLSDNWTFVGETSGSTKHHVGRGLTGGIENKERWKDITSHRKPFARESVSKKRVFCRWIKPFTDPQTCKYKSSWKSGTAAGTDEERALAKERKNRRALRMSEAAKFIP